MAKFYKYTSLFSVLDETSQSPASLWKRESWSIHLVFWLMEGLPKGLSAKLLVLEH
jgi:hypothetical protein